MYIIIVSSLSLVRGLKVSSPISVAISTEFLFNPANRSHGQTDIKFARKIFTQDRFELSQESSELRRLIEVYNEFHL